jgi:SAM-dependent methyltransferase/uncharacterized protein YbaR (Trm112 family)
MICPACKGELDGLLGASEEITCTHCGNLYPLIVNRIPILLEDPQRYLATLYLQYEQYLRLEQLEVHKIDLASKVVGASRLTNIKTAMQENAVYVGSIQDALVKHLSAKALASLIVERKFIPYTTSWAYLQRDWCWLPEGEQELNTIKNSLFKAMNKWSPSLDSVLVVGAGAGRIAWELCEICKHVYATDNALTMVYQFYDLLEHDIPFSEINRNNIFDSDDAVRSLRASLHSPYEDARKSVHRQNKLSYFVGDALNTPLQDHSVSAIVSVYFTDLVPMKAYVQEIKRLLKHSGMFFHFGPLEYDLPNVSDHLSASDIKAIFAANNFAICEDEQIVTAHLPSELSMSARTYNNWMFVAINQNKTTHESEHEITLNSILSVVNDIHYEIQGSISAHTENLIETNLLLPSGEKYVGAKSVLDILRTIDGSRRNYEVIEILSREYEIGDEETKNSILEVMTTLSRKKVLSVVEF